MTGGAAFLLAPTPRAPLPRWLAQVEFDQELGALEAIFADTACFIVPCVKLAPKLKESP